MPSKQEHKHVESSVRANSWPAFEEREYHTLLLSLCKCGAHRRKLVSRLGGAAMEEGKWSEWQK